MYDFYYKKGDTAPAIAGQLKDRARNVMDLSGASVRFLMMDDSGSAKVDALATITDAANGKIKYDWSAGDTDTAGSFSAEWEVTYGDGTTETFPSHEYISIRIEEDIA